MSDHFGTLRIEGLRKVGHACRMSNKWYVLPNLGRFRRLTPPEKHANVKSFWREKMAKKYLKRALCAVPHAACV